MRWICHAQPAPHGAPCFHLNERGGTTHYGMVCCEKCGATKTASDDRWARKMASSSKCRCGHPPHEGQCYAPDGCWCDTFTERSQAMNRGRIVYEVTVKSYKVPGDAPREHTFHVVANSVEVAERNGRRAAKRAKLRRVRVTGVATVCELAR
jgi:hypothetical protein